MLDVYGGEDASRLNTNVQIYPYARRGNQAWVFEEATLEKPINFKQHNYEAAKMHAFVNGGDFSAEVSLQDLTARQEYISQNNS